MNRLLRRALTPADAPGSVDRTRKEVLINLGLVAGVGFLLLGVFGVATAGATTGRLLVASGSCFAAAALLSAAAYVTATKTVSRSLCEAAVCACAVACAVADMGALLLGWCDATGFIVLVLDCLLVCDCRDSTAKWVVVLFGVWVLVRQTLITENIRDDPCADELSRFSLGYFFDIALGASDMIVVGIDFSVTRGFAQSMKEQKSLVEASIQVSELAAVRLSRYETDATQELLEGAEGERLPGGLREALLQLVGNLARYRPYLPQSCLPSAADAGESETESEPAEECDTDARTTGWGRDSHRRSAEASVCSSSLASAAAQRSPRRASLCVDQRHRRVSLAAVNSKSFLTADSTEMGLYLHSEVDAFIGVVAAERGVVDLISGDHLFANFNASRMCTTHRVSAARTVWSMCGDSAVAHAERVCRTGTACSGQALCGDFGTSELRRFMVVGAAASTLQCLERVAAQLRTALVDDAVGGDADVASGFFTALVERVRYSKRGPKPFLVWQLAGRREECKDPSEWMYELEQQAPNPYEEWNTRIASWLGFGEVYGSEQPAAVPAAAAAERVAGARQQSELVEAAVVGGTVALQFLSADA